MRKIPRGTYVMEVKRGLDGLWYFHTKAANGEIVSMSSEGYTRKWSAKRAAKKVADTPVVE